MAAALRAGLLGLGMMGRNHARVLRGLDGVELAAVADPAGDPHQVAGDLAVGRDVDDLVAAGIDLAVVAVPTAFHLAAGLALVAAGVPTLIEKPLAVDSDEAERLVGAFAVADVPGCVGHVERYNPALIALRTRLERGELGAIHQVATRRQGPFPNRVADVGVVKDLATHDIDLAAWVIRSPYVSVSAYTQHKSGRQHEDLVAVTARMADGTVANHLVNWLSPMKERITVVTGERGCFVADTLTADLTFHENGIVPTEWDRVASFRGVTEGNSTRFAIPKPEPLVVELEQFRDLVLGKDASAVTLEEGLATVRVADACIRSASLGETVRVDHAGSRS
ncbi:MAG: Gfo/Idh/MocA family protein [Nocardioides sp.]